MNQYIRDLAGQDFTAKDFRTWAGTLLAARELYNAGPAETESEAKKTTVEAVGKVAKHLGNRSATCRKYYIHPAILAAYSDRTLFEKMQQGQGSGLRPEEYAAVAIIAKHQETALRRAS